MLFLALFRALICSVLEIIGAFVCLSMLRLCMNCYIGVLGSSESYEICPMKDISYTRTTQKHWSKQQNDDEHPKRNPSQTHQRVTRHNRPSDTGERAHARLPNNNQHTQKLRSLFWTKHNLPFAGRTRKERLPPERVEYGE